MRPAYRDGTLYTKRSPWFWNGAQLKKITPFLDSLPLMVVNRSKFWLCFRPWWSDWITELATKNHFILCPAPHHFQWGRIASPLSVCPIHMYIPSRMYAPSCTKYVSFFLIQWGGGGGGGGHIDTFLVMFSHKICQPVALCHAVFEKKLLTLLTSCFSWCSIYDKITSNWLLNHFWLECKVSSQTKKWLMLIF